MLKIIARILHRTNHPLTGRVERVTYTYTLYVSCVHVRACTAVPVNRWRCNWERIAQGRIRPSVRPLISIENCIFVFEATHNLYFNRSRIVYRTARNNLEPIPPFEAIHFSGFEYYHSVLFTTTSSLFYVRSLKWRNEEKEENGSKVLLRSLLSWR